MAQLQVKPRPGERADKKPKVYFACHPQDHLGYFESLTDEILKISNCAIYYYGPEEDVALDGDYYLNLGQMNLVVMPVTTRLLCMPSRAMDVEFSYAIEHHIPVLPLMQERGLEELYKKKFGDLQFLDKTNADPTAIPYGEKLKKYLESVLIGDELAKKIRAAFDAYVFLSYRKKDRKYAQELMRLLHRDPVCRDIAIWYDEFLTPGENFNESIKKALEKSGLFVLAVTPNLVNETNYIMTTEYPMAQKAGKPILPAEMVATDAEALRSCYPDIPQVIQPENAQTLTEGVLNALGTLARRDNDNDPKHNFFIGLAYLGGIDVEVNHKRAVELITAAAEAGLTEAMEKLVSMYKNGEAVRRDYHEAIRWREKLTELARIEYEQTGTEAAADTYFSRLWELGDSCMGVVDGQKVEQIYTTMKDLAELRHSQNHSRRNKRNLAISYGKMGRISKFQYGSTEAMAWYTKSVEIFETLTIEKNSVRAREDVIISYASLGSVCKAESRFAEAAIWYTKRLEMQIALADETGTVEDQRELCSAYNDIVNICKAEDNLTDAKIWCTKSMEIQKALTDKTGAIEDRRDLSIIYSCLGDICAKKGDIVEARSWETEAVEIMKSLIIEIGTEEPYEELALICQMSGILHSDIEELERAALIYKMIAKVLPEQRYHRRHVRWLMKSINQKKRKRRGSIWQRLFHRKRNKQ